ncbi:MAG: phage major capsid protein [Amphritea sp.]|nr:phage major capsid protein [Amphritea sp.]
MKTLAELMRQRAEIQASIQAIADKESGLPEGESLSAEEVAEFDKLEASFKDITGQIERQEKAQAMQASVATPVAHPGQAAANLNGRDESEPGIGLAQAVVCLSAAQGNHMYAAQIAETQFGRTDLFAAMDVATPNSAGVLVREQTSNEMIELLKPLTVVRRMGARTIPMPNGNLTVPRKTGRGQAGYGPEGADIGKTQSTYGQTKFSAKKLTALTPISNDLIRQASHSALELVRDDLTEAVSLEEDLNFLRSDGSSDAPTGLRHQAHADNIVPDTSGTAAPNLAQVDAYLNSLILKHRLADIPMRDCGWILSPSVYTYLEGLRDGNGNKVYPELANMRLKTFKVEFTNQLPEDLGVGGNESEIYFVDFSQVLIPDTMSISLAISTEASYKDGADMVSAFSRDQTVVRVIAEHDLGLRHDKAVAVGTGVRWGIN